MMNRFDVLFQYWRGSLDSERASAIAQELKESDDSQQEYKKLDRFFGALKEVAELPHPLVIDLSGSVVARIKEEKKSTFGVWLKPNFLAPAIIALGMLALILIHTPVEEPRIWNQGGLGLITYNDDRIGTSVNTVLTYLEGTFGALVMVLSFLFCIASIISRKWKLASSFFTVTISAFILRSALTSFFNDENIMDSGGSLTHDGMIRYNDERLSDSVAGILGIFSGSGGSRINYQAPAPGLNVSNNNPYAHERYGQVAENKRTKVTDQAYSTFAADVDTASYANLRRFLRAGQMPPTGAVRIEEYVNYFSYAYANPKDKPIGMEYELSRSPFDPARSILRLALNTKADLNSLEKGWNLVFLVDVSGSMDMPNKLPLVKESLKLLTERMRPQDRVAIVTYAGSTGLALDSTSGTEKEKILSVIDSLGAGGSTYGSGGITKAYEIAQAHYVPGTVNRVVLATDGDFNVGTTSFDGLMELIETNRKSGVTLTTLGFGTDNLNEAMMEQLADRGNGNYFYIDAFREARKVLDQELNATMDVVAKDVKLQVEFNPNVVEEYRLIGFDNRRLNKEDFKDDTKDGGEIGSGQKVTALYEILFKDKVEPTQANYSDELGLLKIRYKEPEGNKSSELEFPLNKSKLVSLEHSSEDFRFSVAVAHFGELIKQSEYAKGFNYDDVSRLAEDAKGEDKQGYRTEFLQLVDDAKHIGGKEKGK